MISLLVSAALAACVPLAQADAFGEIRFDERVSASDARFASVACDEDGCTGQDRSGVEYRTNGKRLLHKTIGGRGPSSDFQASLTPDAPDSEVLMAPVCIEGGGMWLELDLSKDGAPTYSLLAQP